MERRAAHLLLLLLLPLLLLLETAQLSLAANSAPKLQRCASLNAAYVTLTSTDCSGAVRVTEETPIGAHLMQFEATDPEADPVTMTLTGDRDAMLFFSLQSFPGNRTAVLKTGSRLDAETYPKVFIKMTIQLSDGNGNSPTKTFDVVVVTDVNDNPPEFENMPYRWEIPENTITPSSNFTVTVVDKDRSPNGMTIEFKEVSGSSISGIFGFGAVSQAVLCTGCHAGKRYTRTISLLRPLDYESGRFYQISVNATDTTGGGKSALTDIIINVLDRQDTPPFFEGVPYLRSVAENTPSGTPLLTVVAKDGDRGSPNEVQYQLDTSSPFAKYFALNATSGELSVGSQTLDRESPEILEAFGTVSLKVVAKEVSSPAQPASLSEATATVRIVVLDANDFRPTFGQAVYNASVVENTQAGVPISLSERIVVRDLDVGTSGRFNVTITKGGVAYKDFEATPATVDREGSLSILVVNSSLLDFETVKSLTFQIVATETQTAEKFAGTATVSLTLVDANDNRPVFRQSRYTFALAENAAKGTAVGKVHAEDKDSGAYGTVSYSLEGADAWKFLINTTTGDISVNVEADKNSTLLDRETFPTIYLTAQAADGGGFVTAVQVQVQLSDVNDQVPRFALSEYNAVLRENSMSFETPVILQATDADEVGSNNSAVSFDIAAGNAGGHFGVSSGRLGVVRPVDFENLTSSSLNLTVVARDAGTPSLSASVQVKIRVLDENDNSPRCTTSVLVAKVAENATGGTEVARVAATDADAAGSENSRLFFRIRSGAADKFAIAGDTGVVVVERGANLDVTRFGSSYNLTVVVFDRGSPQRSGNCTVSVTVTDVNNEKPYFPSASRRELVPENLAVGSPLPFLYSATDPDASARLRYSILHEQMVATTGTGRRVSVAVYNFTALLRIEPTNATLFVSSPLDREQAEEIVVPIFVEDLAAETAVPVQTATGTVIVTLADVNDEAPVFQPPAVNGTYRVTVLESLKPPADISLKAVATDADKTSAALVYAVNPPDAFFDIDNSTAQVSLKSRLDRERQAQHTFKVTASDSVHVTTATVIVSVGDANDMEPTFQQFENVTLPENTPVGSVVTTVKANDSDLGNFGVVNYRIVSGGAGAFGINATTGEIRVTAPLDRDTPGGAAFQLVVEAFDNPGGDDSKRTSRTLFVTVTDVNDRTPAFSQDNFTITSLQESMEADQLIKEIPATDGDSGINGQLSFSFSAIPGQSSRGLELFKVATRRSGDSYVAAISTKTSLKNAVGWYNVTLLAKDAGSPVLTGSTNVTFFIADVNDFSPEFVYPNASETVLRVNESTNASSTVNKELLRARAVDRDFGNNSIVRFSLVSSNGDHNSFNIDPVTGLLTIRVSFDRETKSEYRFQIRATDLGEPQLAAEVNIVVEVVDVDESPPVFDEAGRQQQLQVPENSPPSSPVPGLTGVNGVFVGAISKARDPDASSSGTAVCYFVINKMYDKFYLDKRTGRLYALASFNRESASEYTLYIIAVSESFCSSNAYEWDAAPKPSRKRRSLDKSPIAYDPANPAMSKIVIAVADDNDNPPVWSQAAFFGGVTVDEPPKTEVFRFANSVTDADRGNNSHLTFSITRPQPDTEQLRQQLLQLNILDTVLQVEPDTGLLRTGPTTYFQETMAGAFTFNVSATDSKFTATAACTIYLLSLQQQIVITIAEKTENVTMMRDTLANYLSNITGWRVVVDNIVTHKRSDGTADSSKTDVYCHAIRLSDNTIVAAVTLRDKIDLLWASIRVLYTDFGVLSVRLAVEPAELDTALETMRISLIVVACSLTILVFVAFLSLWSCRRMYRRKLKAATAVAFGPNGQAASTMRMPGTNLHTFEGSNPIWLESNYEMQRDNLAFENDKDSIDDNQVGEGVVKANGHPYQFDEVEKSLNFFADNDEEQEMGKGSQEMLSSAVDAGPGIVHQPNGNGSAVHLSPTRLESMQTANI